ncbi:uncharacterized protein FFM5_03122 [Fusarium fujikuroi]|nr:uncharacterized protein FFM5_03122 [Fusarium fujikuroi]
MALLSISSF